MITLAGYSSHWERSPRLYASIALMASECHCLTLHSANHQRVPHVTRGPSNPPRTCALGWPCKHPWGGPSNPPSLTWDPNKTNQGHQCKVPLCSLPSLALQTRLIAIQRIQLGSSSHRGPASRPGLWITPDHVADERLVHICQGGLLPLQGAGQVRQLSLDGGAQAGAVIYPCTCGQHSDTARQIMTQPSCTVETP